MHNMSTAMGRAIATMLEADGIAEEATELAELARTALAMDNGMLAASMMFAQPLIMEWRPHWRFAFTVGLSLGSKWMTEGFFLGDILDRLGEFSVDVLREGEAAALDMFAWGGLNARLRSFRNALHSVAQSDPLLLDESSSSSIRVLIVDRSPHACEHHRTLIHACQPAARVHAVHSVEDAIAHKRAADAAGEQIELVLVALELAPGETAPIGNDANAQLQQVLLGPNAFHVAAAMEGRDVAHQVAAHGPPARTDFLYKPFVVASSEHAMMVHDIAEANDWKQADGSINGCDAVLPVPLAHDQIRALIDCCEL